MPQQNNNPIEDYFKEDPYRFAKMFNNQRDLSSENQRNPSDNKPRAKQRIKEIKAFLQINYGKNGKCIPDLIKKTDTEFVSLIKILEHYDRQLKIRNQVLEEKGIEIID